MTATKPLVPKLRFPEFSDKWESLPMGDLYSYIPTNSFSRDKMNEGSGEVRNIHYGDIHTKFSALLDASEINLPRINRSEPLQKFKERNFCKEGDVIFADASEDLEDIGKCAEIVNTGGLTILSGLHTIHARQKRSRLIVRFAGHLFRSKGIRTQIQRESQGAKVLGIPGTRLSAINVYFPTKAEQQKIADCLGSLDHLIAAHSRKLAALQDHKKGLLQQLFPAEGETTPKLRFPGFEGEWEEKPLKKLAAYQNGKAYEKHILDDGKYAVVNSRFVSTEGMIQKFTNEEFCPAKKGDVLMVLSDLPKGRALAKCFFVEDDNKYGVNQRVARLSWLCRDHKIEDEGDGSCDIIFSNRSNMSYEDIQSYLKHLIARSGSLPQEVQIDASVILPEQIKAVEHSKLAGLQAADAVASSMHFAVKRNPYGESEPAYSRLLTKTFYRHKNTLQGYGIKLWPDTLAEVQTKAPEAKHLEGL